MKKFLKCSKGAIAVFLAIIVIPLITLTSIFVDSSKVVLARALAESSGDLALNTILTNYDTQLNEYFGLIASCQSMDDAYDLAAKFFEESMMSAATDMVNQSGLSYQLSKIGSKKSYTDFLGLTVSGENGVEAKALDNGSLANPAVLKKQIVEFNKYRAPINTAVDLLNWFTKAKEQIDELEEITEMTDKKNEFYEDESGLVDSLKKLRDELLVYDGKGINSAYIAQLQDFLKTDGEIDSFYKDLHTKIIFDYLNVYNSEGKHIESSWGKLPSEFVSEKYKEIDVSVATENGTETKKVPDIEYEIKECLAACQKFKEKETEFLKMLINNGIIDDNCKDIYESKKGSIYNVQYWALTEKALQDNKQTIEEFTAEYNNMNIRFKKVNACIKKYNSLDSNIRDAYEKKRGYTGPYSLIYSYINYKGTTCYIDRSANDYNGHVDAINNFVNNANKGDGPTEYNDLRNRLNGMYSNITNGTDEYKKNGNIKKATADAQVANYSQKLNDYKSTLQDGAEIIQNCINITSSLEDKLEDYNKSFKEWDNSVGVLSGSKQDIVKTDENEISQKKGNSGNGKDVDRNDALLSKVTSQQIKELETRLTEVKTLLDNGIKAIDELKYCDKKVIEIDSVAVATDAVKSAAEKSNVSYNSFFNSDIEKLEKVRTFNTPNDSAFTVTNSNNPDLSVNEPELRKNIYEYFAEQEKNKSGETEEEAEKKEKEAKDKKKDLKDSSEKEGDFETSAATNASSNEIKDAENLPSSGETTANKNASKTSDLTSITETVHNLFTNLGENVRDDLLITDYIMRMFSYDTFEEELLIDCATDNKYKLSTITDWNNNRATYTKTMEENATESSWSYNKNLRNIKIDANTSWSYLNEVEYILYGGKNADNKLTAACYIYAIRVACNLVPVFSHFWKDASVIGLATSLSAATCGVLPVSLIKLLICLTLTLVESGIDMKYIKAGFGVKFFKDENSLFTNFSVSDLTGSESDNSKAVGVGVNKGFFQYSDYLQFFVLLKTMGTQGESDVLRRTGDVIQVNMKCHNEDFLLINSQVYFNISAEVSVKPLMLSQPINASDSNPFTKLNEIVKFTYNMTRGY